MTAGSPTSARVIGGAPDRDEHREQPDGADQPDVPGATTATDLLGTDVADARLVGGVGVDAGDRHRRGADGERRGHLGLLGRVAVVAAVAGAAPFSPGRTKPACIRGDRRCNQGLDGASRPCIMPIG